MSIAGDRYRHGLHRADARDVFQADRAASPLELLYDLTFVATFGVAASELAHGITSDHAAQAVLAFVVAMTAVLWAWMNFTWFASAFDNDDWLFRLMTIVQMAGVLALAIALPSVFASLEEGGEPVNSVMVGGYIVMRVAVILQWLRVAHDEARFRRSAVTYAAFAGAAQLGWFLLATRHLDGVTALWAVGALFAVEALAPVVAGVNGATRRGAGTPWHPQHIAERHTLLAIIALGDFGSLQFYRIVTGRMDNAENIGGAKLLRIKADESGFRSTSMEDCVAALEKVSLPTKLCAGV